MWAFSEYVEEIETPGAAEAAAASNRLNLGSIPNEQNPSSFKLFNLLGGNLPGVFPKPSANPLPKKAEKRLYGGAYLCTLCTFENTFRKGTFSIFMNSSKILILDYGLINHLRRSHKVEVTYDNFEQYGYFHCPKCSQWYRDQTQLQCLGMVFNSFMERIHTHLKEVSIWN